MEYFEDLYRDTKEELVRAFGDKIGTDFDLPEHIAMCCEMLICFAKEIDASYITPFVDREYTGLHFVVTTMDADISNGRNHIFYKMMPAFQSVRIYSASPSEANIEFVLSPIWE